LPIGDLPVVAWRYEFARKRIGATAASNDIVGARAATSTLLANKRPTPLATLPTIRLLAPGNKTSPEPCPSVQHSLHFLKYH
jgi:hypothetical protein